MDHERAEQTTTPQPGNPARPAVFAGRFYPAGEVECRTEAEAYIAAAEPGYEETGQWIGGLVPHAGWRYSGAIAAQTIAMLAKNARPDVVVIFGAIHTPLVAPTAMLDVHGRWEVPGGSCEVSGLVQGKLAESTGLFGIDRRFHENEHAVEVELPLVRAVWPVAMILPVEVPVNESAVEVGRAVAKRILEVGLRAVYLASSDLTHYGPSYRFTPSGIGPGALNWAKGNDRRVLELMTDMQPERIVPEVRSRLNACGAGAISAMLAACREHGASGGRLLKHVNSYEVLGNLQPQAATDAVGYASVVVG